MGIRIHKVVGYGLLRVDFRKDPRLQSHALHSLDPKAHEEKFPQERDLRKALAEHLKQKTAPNTEAYWEYALELKSVEEAKDPWAFHDVMRYNSYVIERKPSIGPLVFTIPYAGWERYDDVIDYLEETQRTVRGKGEIADRCQLITDSEGQPVGIYPYNVGYVHRDKGPLQEKLSTFARTSITRAFREHSEIRFKPTNSFGTATLVEWQRHIVPEVPLFIRAFCECFDIFKDPRMVQRLRPIVYTYWS